MTQTVHTPHVGGDKMLQVESLFPAILHILSWGAKNILQFLAHFLAILNILPCLMCIDVIFD
jgi:hypothetical protein